MLLRLLTLWLLLLPGMALIRKAIKLRPRSARTSPPGPDP
jgi:hypothetical protein